MSGATAYVVTDNGWYDKRTPRFASKREAELEASILRAYAPDRAYKVIPVGKSR